MSAVDDVTGITRQWRHGHRCALDTSYIYVCYIMLYMYAVLVHYRLHTDTAPSRPCCCCINNFQQFCLSFEIKFIEINSSCISL